MQNEGFTKNEDGVFQGNPNGLPRIFGALEKLAAFVNPATANNKGLLSKIISQCDKWNLPAPLQAVTKYLKLQFSGREVNSLSREELIQLSPEVLKNSPPELIGRVMETQALDEYKMSEIGKFGNSTKREGIYGNAFFKGLVKNESLLRPRSSFYAQFGLIGGPACFLHCSAIQAVCNWEQIPD